MRNILGMSVLVAAAAAAAPVGAVTIAYANFSNTSGLQLNGNTAAANDGARDVLRLTPAQGGQSGSAFSTSAITLGGGYSFSTAFTFNLNANGGAGGGADGLVFTLQTNSNTAGGGGGGIGYEGIPNSVGVKFDTFQNGGDISANFIGLVSGGNIVSSVANSVESPFTLKNGGDLTAFIDYDGSSQSLQVRLSNTGMRPLLATLTTSIDIAAALGTQNAFAGFTSGTGAGYANHDIINWQFRDSFSPIVNPTDPGGVPEPSTWMMMIAGFGAVGGTLRGRRRSAVLARG